MRNPALIAVLFLLAPALAPAQEYEEYLGGWEWVATLDWLMGAEEYAEGSRQRIVLRESTVTIILPQGGGRFSYEIEWSDLGFTVLEVSPETTIWPIAHHCQPNFVELFSGETWYPFTLPLPCTDEPCLRIGFGGCTDSPLYFFVPIEPEVSVEPVSLGTLKARY